MAEIQDTDLMLVNRDGASYKVTGAEVKDSIGGELPTIGSAVLSEQNPNTAERFTNQNFDLDITCLTGKAPIFYDLKAKVYGNIGLNFETSNVTEVRTHKAFIYGTDVSSSGVTTNLGEAMNVIQSGGWFGFTSGGGDNQRYKNWRLNDDSGIRVFPGDIVECNVFAATGRSSGISFEKSGGLSYRSWNNDAKTVNKMLAVEDKIIQFNAERGNIGNEHSRINWIKINGEYPRTNTYGSEVELVFADSTSLANIKVGSTVRQSFPTLSYSDNCSGTLDESTNYEYAYAFDGFRDLSRSARPAEGSTITCTLPEPLKDVIQVRLHGYFKEYTTSMFKINGANQTLVSSGPTINDPVVFNHDQSDITSIAWHRPNGSTNDIRVAIVEVRFAGTDNDAWFPLQDGGTAVGRVLSVDLDTNSINLQSNGAFRSGMPINTDLIVTEEATQWLKFDQTGKLISPYLVNEDPGYVRMNPGNDTTESFTFDFPTVLADGNAPDVILTPGTKIQALVKPGISKNGTFEFGPEVSSNEVLPVTTSYDFRYVLRNKNTEPNAGDPTFDSGDFTLSNIEPYSYLVVVDNTDRNPVYPNEGYGGPTGGKAGTGSGTKSNDVWGQPAKFAMWKQIRTPVSVQVTGVNGDGTITSFTQIDPGTAKGIADHYAYNDNAAEFTGGSGSGAKFNMAKDSNKFIFVQSINDGGTGYIVDDVITFVSNPGTGVTNSTLGQFSDGLKKDTIDSDWDVLIHGVAGAGGNSHPPSNQSTGWGYGGTASYLSGNGNAGNGRNGVTGGAGGVLESNPVGGTSGTDATSSPDSAAGGGGAGWAGGNAGQANGNTGQGSGSGGAGASYVSSFITNGSTNTDVTGEPGTELYIEGAYFRLIKNESFIIALTASPAGTYRSDDPAQTAAYNALKANIESYQGSVEAFRSSMTTTLANAGLTAAEILTLGL